MKEFLKELLSSMKAAVPGAQELCSYQKPLDGHGLSYLSELRAEYKTLIRIEPNAQAKELIEDILAKNEKANWDDVFSFELALLKLLPEEKLRRKIWTIRQEYQEMASAEDWQAYQSTKPPDADLPGTPITALRADGEQLLFELKWLYITEPNQELLRGKVALAVGISSGLALLFALIARGVSVSKHHNTLAMLLVLFGFGSIGGLISTLIRVPKVVLADNEEVNLRKLNNLTWSAQLAPWVGGVFAILLYLLFASGLVEGALFPKVHFANCGPYDSGARHTAATETNAPPHAGGVGGTNQPESLPAAANDSHGDKPTGDKTDDCKPWAMLLVWSFIAGFAERLVPDIIDRLANKAEEK